MKKLLLVLAVAGFAIACNNDSEKKDADRDTTVKVVGGDTVTRITDTDTTVRGNDTTIKKTIDTDTTNK